MEEDPNTQKDSHLSTIINDCVHGHIQLSHNLMRIVDTPQVQRLRDLKQLGLGSHVYPGATHTRFAHSIGVCHLAGTFVRQLQSRQKDLNITDRDIFCVEVAGLCHDLGHGPFSHLFESAVKSSGNKDWKHEKASLDLFNMMIEDKDNKLDHLFHKGETDFIKELIHSKENERKAGGTDKEFLYEIVSNERTGLDVDKFDYFARDCHALGISTMFDHNRFFLMSRVLRCEDGKLHICHKDKELENVIIMLQTRFNLHRCAYKHPVVCALDKMVCDAFILADKYLETQVGDKKYSLTESIKDMGAYIRLRDSVLQRIRDHPSNEDSIQAAKDLVKRIDQRHLYRLVHNIKNYEDLKLDKMTVEDIEAEIEKRGKGQFLKEDIYVQIAEFGFGMKKKNPLNQLYVYSKQTPDEAVLFNPNMVSYLLLPKIFSEENLRVYCKAEDKKKCEDVENAAKEWEKQEWEKQLPPPQC